MGMLRTNIVLDAARLQKAKKVTGIKATRAVVDFALKRLTESSKTLASLVGLSGKIHFQKGYSYKKARA